MESRSEEQEDIFPLNEVCDGTSILSDYLASFLKNSRYANSQDDKRVLFYRGQSNAQYKLTPSVFRKGLLSKEHQLISDIMLESPEEFVGIHSSLERLIKMQHYGLPTRLIDVTFNPLVALYFACCSNKDCDGEIITFYDYLVNPTDLNVRCLSEISEYYGSTERQMLGFLSERGISNPELVTITSKTHIPIRVQMNNERIRRQRGLFVIVGIHGESGVNPFQKVEFDLKEFVVKDYGDGIPRSTIIRKEDKSIIMQELDALGINQGFLFPEFEHQAQYIRQKFEEE